MSKRRICFILILIITILLGSAVFYYSTMKSAVLVADTSFTALIPEKLFRESYLTLLKNGIRLKIVTLDSDNLTSREGIKQRLSEIHKPDFILLSPVVTAAVKLYELDVCYMFRCQIAGISDSEDNKYVSYILKSDTESVWYDVESEYYSVPVKDVYTLESEDYKTDFFNTYCYGEETETFVVDYRCRTALPKDKIVAVVCPDITGAIIDAINGKFDYSDRILNYVLCR